jgi:hypothetical protein
MTRVDLVGEMHDARRRREDRTQKLLLADVAEGIRVFVVRDGLDLTEEQINERAANIVASLIGNYRITPLDPS